VAAVSADDWNTGNNGAWTDAAEWSSGAAPTSTDDVTVSFGEAQVTTNVPTIASLSLTASYNGAHEGYSIGQVYLDGGALDIVGALDLGNAGGYETTLLDLENGSNLT
jgi:hypothetical protein